MTNVTAIQPHQGAGLAGLDAETMEKLVSGGDCSRLNAAQKTAYYAARCEAAGLDPRAQPFAFMKLNGKEVLYALKAASDQLAAKHGVRMAIVSQVTEDGIRVVTVRAEAKDGRVTEEIGALPVKGLVGENMANALMKCVTKAKRRAVLSLCGLGMLDETEVDSVPHAEPLPALPPAPVEMEVVQVPAPPPVKVEPPKAARAGPPEYVLALFNRLLAANGKNKTKTQSDFVAAARDALSESPDAPPKPSSEWTVDDAKKVEAILFPDDIPF